MLMHIDIVISWDRDLHLSSFGKFFFSHWVIQLHVLFFKRDGGCWLFFFYLLSRNITTHGLSGKSLFSFLHQVQHKAANYNLAKNNYDLERSHVFDIMISLCIIKKNLHSIRIRISSQFSDSRIALLVLHDLVC